MQYYSVRRGHLAVLKIVKNLWAVRAPPRTPLESSQRSPRPVMWSETVGFRTRPVRDQKNRSWSWSCRFYVVFWNTILSCSSLK